MVTYARFAATLITLGLVAISHATPAWTQESTYGADTSSAAPLDRDLEQQREQVVREFPLVAGAIAFLERLSRFCQVDQACFDQVQQRCLEGGSGQDLDFPPPLPPRFCFEQAQRVCCRPPVFEVTVEPAPPPPFVTDLTLELEPMRVKLDRSHPPAGCPQPRPRDVGCTTLCKPCLTWFCADGEWQPVRFDAEDICHPGRPSSGGSPRPCECRELASGFCPAECCSCF